MGFVLRTLPFLAILIYESSGEQGMSSRPLLIPVKKRLRFREEDDLSLLREVAGQNPFENPSVWENIKENLYILSQKDFSIKTLKEHLMLLIKAWLEKIKTLKDRSGIEEDYNEKDQLCQNIHDYMIQYREKPKKLKNAASQEKYLGKSARDKWASNFSNNIVESPTINNIDDFKENFLLQDHMYCDNDMVGNEEIVETENTPSYLDLHDYSAAVTPRSSSKAITETKSTTTPVQSKVLRPVKTRKRKINIQRQGLNYLEKYDEEQKAVKQREYKLEERRIELEERKCALDEAKHALEERRVALQEKQYEMEREKEKIKLTLEKEKQMAEIEERRNINDNIKKQTELLGILINKLPSQ